MNALNSLSNGTGAFSSRRGRSALLAVLVLAGGFGAAGAAQAEGDRKPRVPLTAAYVQECGACHTVYAPGLLPADSWRRLMGGLGKHYGNDASLDPATAKDIGAWLVEHSGGRKQEAAPPQDRITLTRWFTHEHDEIGAATWKRAAIKSPSNCSACHQNTEQGRYSEHDVKIPK